MATGTEPETRSAVAPLAVSLVVGGSVLVAGSGFLVWLDVLGSKLSGYRLAELISDFGDELPGVPPTWVGVAWYAIPALAAICWLLAFRTAPATATPGHGAIGVVLGFAAGVYLVTTDVQPGPIVALVGAVAVALGGAWGSRA